MRLVIAPDLIVYDVLHTTLVLALEKIVKERGEIDAKIAPRPVLPLGDEVRVVDPLGNRRHSYLGPECFELLYHVVVTVTVAPYVYLSN